MEEILTTQSSSTESWNRWKNKTVIIVDDSDLMIDTLSDLYQSLGFNVVAKCKKGTNLIEKYMELKPDLVSLDIIMPEMNGIECVKLLKSQFPNANCILVSCLSNHIALKEGLNNILPPEYFIAKPVESALLEKALERMF